MAALLRKALKAWWCHPLSRLRVGGMEGGGKHREIKHKRRHFINKMFHVLHLLAFPPYKNSGVQEEDTGRDLLLWGGERS